ncbi:lanthionine synthetase C family protein [Streptomyces inhibens]|uniref:lanthionine synthetase C family protein n=1 Tax=Streptomyces inhibens TaxID=2293571 RepID=UPI0036CC88FC
MTAPAAAKDTARESAGRIVADLAERLADPGSVVRAATAPGNLDCCPGRPAPQPPWHGLALSEGHPGVALLFAELSRTAPAHRTALHAHLTAAARELPAPSGGCLFEGAPALAFAARAARHAPDDYAELLDHLDELVGAQLRALLAEESARLDAGRAGVRLGAYDTLAGAAGLARHLLLDPARHPQLLRDTLSYFVRLTRPVRAHGRTVPGWWVPTQPAVDPDARFTRGHFNLGLAHGICGPLVLLARGWEEGIRVPGHEEAMARIADHLLAFRRYDGLWPGAIGFDDFLSGDRAPAVDDNMVAWCYGTPGVARALYLAGRALDRADWRRTAVQALGDALGLRPPGATDSSLCHGWAGLLHLTWRMADDSGDRRLAELVPRLAAPVLDAYDAALPFGFRYERPGLPPDRSLAAHRAGFLEGAAGIGLALHTYATGRAPSGHWDAALLLS